MTPMQLVLEETAKRKFVDLYDQELVDLNFHINVNMLINLSPQMEMKMSTLILILMDLYLQLNVPI